MADAAASGRAYGAAIAPVGRAHAHRSRSTPAATGLLAAMLLAAPACADDRGEVMAADAAYWDA